MKMFFNRYLFLAFFFVANPVFSATGNPVLLYTDITSGPNTGGENNHGIYVSLFGKNFGKDMSKIKVTIGGIEVSDYKFLGTAKGRPDIQQLTVQPGPAVSSGKLKVEVNGVSSNTDQSFTVRPGDIYFVSLNGSSSNGEIGNINKPFRNAQTVFDRSDFTAGDFLVMRGGTWKDVGRYNAFLSFYNKTGTLAKPFTAMAYPGERVLLDTQGSRGGFNFYLSEGGIVISGFEVNGNGNDLIQMQAKTNNMRIVNNELYGLWQSSGGSAAIVGNGHDWKVFGNSVHDNGYSKLFHAIYIDNDSGNGSDNIDVGYNHVYNQTGGRGIQVFWFNPSMTNITIHDNLIHDIDNDGIVISDNSGDGIVIYNNVIYKTGVVTGAGIRVNSSIGRVKIFNNTLYNAAVARNKGALFFENAASIELRNNIVYSINGQSYLTNNVSSSTITASNNLWYGDGGAPSIDKSPLNANPLFVDSSALDFHLQSGSPAIDAGTDMFGLIGADYDGIAHTAGGKYDLGAYEYSQPAMADTTPPAAPSMPSLSLQ